MDDSACRQWAETQSDAAMDTAMKNRQGAAHRNRCWAAVRAAIRLCSGHGAVWNWLGATALELPGQANLPVAGF